jgi:hypothetical protein
MTAAWEITPAGLRAIGRDPARGDAAALDAWRTRLDATGADLVLEPAKGGA